MARLTLLAFALMACALQAGCRGCWMTNCYANRIDDISDTKIHFDNWYCPKLDISRAGKPDWCGADGRACLGHYCCCEGAWDEYDDCHLYPPSHPYVFPSHSMPNPELTPATPRSLPPVDPTTTPPPPIPIE